MAHNDMEFYLEQQPRTHLSMENFYKEFLANEVYFLLAEPLPAGIINDFSMLSPSAVIAPVIMPGGSQGLKDTLFVYTSNEEMATPIKEGYVHYLKIKGRVLLESFSDLGFAINNYNQNHSFYISREEAKNILEFFGTKTLVSEGGHIQIGRPAVDPVGLKEALVEVCKKHDSVINALYFTLGYKPEKSEYSYLLVLDANVSLNDPLYKLIADEFGHASHGWLPKGYFLDTYLYDDKNEFLVSVAQNEECIFKGKRT